MTITYTENEKRHILESSNGYVSTYLKSQLSKEEAEQAFKLSLKVLGTPTEQEAVTEEFTEFTEVETPAKKNGKK